MGGGEECVRGATGTPKLLALSSMEESSGSFRKSFPKAARRRLSKDSVEGVEWRERKKWREKGREREKETGRDRERERERERESRTLPLGLQYGKYKHTK